MAAAINLDFELQLLADRPTADARIILRQDQGSLRELQLSAGSFTGKPEGDGQLRRVFSKLIWKPPASGGELRYQVRLTHRRSARDASSHDAWVGSKLAIFRADKAFPVTAWRLKKNSSLHGVLGVAAPGGWSVITPYLPDQTGRMPIRNPPLPATSAPGAS